MLDVESNVDLDSTDRSVRMLKVPMLLRNNVRNVTALGGLAIGGFAVLGAGCAESKAGTSGPPPPTVVVAPVVQRDVVLYIEALGSLDGYVNADIRARVRGILAGQRYQDGATVKPGQLLFSIDRSEFRIAVDSARAALARAETALAREANEPGGGQGGQPARG